jgi:hypothetical protein
VISVVKKTRDSNLDHPAVKLYRDICHITPNHVQRREIVVTINWAKEEVCFGTDEQRLKSAVNNWEGVLRKFMLEGCNPKRVDWAIDRFESRMRGETKNK